MEAQAKETGRASRNSHNPGSRPDQAGPPDKLTLSEEVGGGCRPKAMTQAALLTSGVC